jgi:hexosaminidase
VTCLPGRGCLIAKVLFIAGFCLPVFGQTSSSRLMLVPMPREIKVDRPINLGAMIAIESSSDPEDTFAAQELANEFRFNGVKLGPAKAGLLTIRLLRLNTNEARKILSEEHIEFTEAMLEDGYVLVSKGNALYDIATSSCGIFYGVQTLKQLISRNGDEAALPKMRIRDWPAMKYRAQDDDLSRGPVPTLEYQKRQIRMLAAYKINIYSPYFEHTLEYVSNPLPAPPGGTMSAEQVEELVRYARQFHVTVIPQQEAFGHLHHVLTYERYAHLAETPHGSVLAPGQSGSQELIGQWFAEVTKMFPSPFIHIGADETDDLGSGQTRQLVAERGLGAVYIDFLKEIHQTLLPFHKRLLFWGDVAMNSPELVKSLPKDMVAVAWKYSMPEDGSGSFDPWIKPFVDAGIETWVAPSASRGNRIFPGNDNNLKTIQAFVADGQRLGATGMFNTVWDDGGEGLFEQDWYGILFGAAASWQSGRSDISQFEQSFGWTFHRDPNGYVDNAEMELSQAHLILIKAGLQATNALFWEDPWSRAGQSDSVRILPVAHELRLHAETAMELIAKAKNQPHTQNLEALEAMELGARKMDFIGEKFQLTQEMLDEYSEMLSEQNDQTKHDEIMDKSFLITGNNGQCQDLRDGYGLLRDLYREAWLRENRPYWLDNVSAQYDLNMQLWIRRGTMIREVANAFDKGGKLTLPEEWEIPVGIGVHSVLRH